MSESTTISAEQSSTKSLLLSKKDLQERISEFPEETIANVSDEMFRPVILLKDIDGNPYWRPYGGESLEDVRMFHKWELEAQKQFKEKSRSQEELDYLRNAIMSVSMICDLLDITEEGDLTVSELLSSVGWKISIRWYCKDNGHDYKTYDIDQVTEDIKVYYQLAMFYIQSFINTIKSIKDNVSSISTNS